MKLLLRKILTQSLIKKLTISLLRRRLISKRFKNLIELEGFYNLHKSNISIFNSKFDAVSRDLCIFGIGKKEQIIFNKFVEEVKHASSFLDIGAGIGLYTLFAIKLNPKISTLSIEANPEVFSVFKKNLINLEEFNQSHKTLNKFVSREVGNIEFNIPTGDDFSYGTSKKKFLEQKNIQFKQLQVPTTDISDFKHSRFEIIKIDVEGSELDALFAISDFLKYCKLLFIEIFPENKSEVYKLLKKYNFQVMVESNHDVGNYIFQSS
ncbi:MAG: hypothetical protein CMD13_03980 [Flavobacteriales bacterium]|nr:hypothetical protein [Flavobacteriales bacterium]